MREGNNPENSSEKGIDEMFLTPYWQQHIDLISHLSQFSQDVLLIVSPPGGGKTSLAKYFMSIDNPAIQKIFIKGTADKNWDHLLAEILKTLELPEEDVQDSVGLKVHLQRRFAKEKILTVLVIDDAHHLDDSTLHKVLQLLDFDEFQPPLHLLLFAMPSLEMRLFSFDASILQGRFYTIEIEPWTLAELSSYFEQTAFSFKDQKQVERIFEKSQGLPGIAISEALSNQKSFSKVGKKMNKFDFKGWCTRPILIGAVVGVTVGITYLFINTAEEEGSTSIPINMAQIAESEWENQDAPKKSDVKFEFDATEDDEQSNTDAQSGTAIDPELPKIEQTGAQFEDPEMMEDLPESMKPLETQASLTIAKAAPAKGQELQVSPKIVETSASNHSLNAKEAHLLKTAGDHYTIQLLGARSEESIKQFIHHHGIEANAHYYRTQLGGKDWYVMVYGDYPSKEAAKAATQKFPESLQSENLQPWIREVSTIQQDIRERGQA